jgi:hypothetical protein
MYIYETIVFCKVMKLEYNSSQILSPPRLEELEKHLTLFGWRLFLPSLLHFQNVKGRVRQKHQRSPIDLFVFADEDGKEMMKRV